MKNIIIMGGGISGLTSCFELSNDYNIILFERNNILGGLARTKQNELKKTCPYEYSWRAYGKWYQNVFDVMKRIPLNKKIFKNGNTVFDNLTNLEGGKKTCNKKIKNYNSLNNMDKTDYIKMLPTFLSYITSNDEENISNYSGVSLKEYIKKNNLSKSAEDRIGKIIGPYLGMEYDRASVYDILYADEMMRNNNGNHKYMRITKYPTNFAWFDPWELFLKNKKNVSIKKNTEVSELIFNGNKMESIIIIDKNTNKKRKIKGDYFISALSPESLTKLLRNKNKIPNCLHTLSNNMKNVSENGKQIQLCVYYYLDIKIFLNRTNTLAYLPNTPWLLMVLPTGHIWGDNFLKKYCNNNIKEIISVGICQPYIKGNLIKKKWSECTKEEIRIEAWNQLINDMDFKNSTCTCSKKLKDIKPLHFTMWDTYNYDNNRTGDKMSTQEPKWANNINTRQYRPKCKTKIPNFFLAGAYTDTSTGLYSMESATESGKIASIELYKYDKGKKSNIFLHTKKKSRPFTFLRNINITNQNNVNYLTKKIKNNLMNDPLNPFNLNIKKIKKTFKKITKKKTVKQFKNIFKNR